LTNRRIVQVQVAVGKRFGMCGGEPTVTTTGRVRWPAADQP
jgi:hypothetical protein